MRVYIAGPMTGKLHYNAYAFQFAAEAWKGAGHEVETPFEANSRVWRRHHGRDFDPFADKCDYGDALLAEMLVEDVATIARADAIALLEGWRESKGARSEVLLALNMGKKIFDARTFQEMRVVPSLSFSDENESVLLEAQRLVHGDRGASYGHPIHDYRATGRMFAAAIERWLRSLGGTFAEIELPDIPPAVATQLMVLVKVSRQVHKPKRDNLVDEAGYAECTSMILDREARQG